MLGVIDTLAADELPEDLDGAARARGGRKLKRLLDTTAVPPFLAACTLLDRHPDVVAADTGLFTVSAWEADIPPLIERHDGSEESRRRQAETYQQVVNPVDWLSGLANNALCQSAIALGLHGPNAHLVGGGAVVVHALRLIEDALAGTSALALLVAFDPPVGQQVVPPATVTTRACSILVSADPAAGVPIEACAPAPARELRSVDLLESVIAAVRRGTGEDVHGVAVRT